MLLLHLIVFIKREGARNSAFNIPLTFAKWGKQLVQYICYSVKSDLFYPSSQQLFCSFGDTSTF